MAKLALCMIVKDNAKIIERCLSSVINYIDEAVIVDTGSEDDTPWVIEKFFNKKNKRVSLEKFTPKTHPEHFLLDTPETWQNRLPGKYSGKYFLANFGAARQFGWEISNADFKFWIDSDDVFENANNIPIILQRLTETKSDTGLLYYDYSKDKGGNVNCKLIRERFFQKISKAKWDQPIHEVIHPVENAKLFLGPLIVHKKFEDGFPPSIEHRNLKVLLKWYDKWKDKIQNGKNFDIRNLFYLGVEERFLFPEEALYHFEIYTEKSGWDEERALAYALQGEIYERKNDLKNAHRYFAQATVDFPTSPDGLFGLARNAFNKSDYAKCVAHTEAGFKSMTENHGRIQALMHDPSSRTWRPYVFYARSLTELGRIEEAKVACQKGLASKPSEPNLIKNLKLVNNILGKIKNGDNVMQFRFTNDENLDSPPQKIPPGVIAAFVLNMWKDHIAKDNYAKALNLLESLPDDVAYEKTVRAAREITIKKLEGIPSQKSDAESISHPQISSTTISQNKLDIIIWTGPAWERWSPANIDTTGIGGSETAAIMMSFELAKRGHQVTMIGDHLGFEGQYGPKESQVKYVNHQKAMADPFNYKADIFVCSRQPQALEIPFSWKASYLWIHDIHVGNPEGRIDRLMEKTDKIFALSYWHKKVLLGTYPFLTSEKIIVTKNGIDLKRFEKEPIKEGNRIIYSSSPDRGLLRLLELLPHMRKEVPDVHLDVYYGFENWKKATETSGDQREKDRIQWIEKRLNELEKERSLTHHGRVNQQTLADAFLRAKVWTYPTWFSESFCISAIEAQAAGCVPVSTVAAALPETVSNGFLIQPPNDGELYKDAYVRRVVHLLKDEDIRGKYARAGREYAFLNHGWDRVAETWEEEFFRILREKKHLPDLLPESTKIELPSFSD